jgi:hypothetical protein
LRIALVRLSTSVELVDTLCSSTNNCATVCGTLVVIIAIDWNSIAATIGGITLLWVARIALTARVQIVEAFGYSTDNLTVITCARVVVIAVDWHCVTSSSCQVARLRIARIALIARIWSVSTFGSSCVVDTSIRCTLVVVITNNRDNVASTISCVARLWIARIAVRAGEQTVLALSCSTLDNTAVVCTRIVVIAVNWLGNTVSSGSVARLWIAKV